MRAARLFNERAVERLQDNGHPLRGAHVRLFPFLDFDGTRLTDLAAKAGITKQSAQLLVDEMVAGGYLKRRPDPEDGRAKLIVLTPKGLRGVADGLRILGSIEAEIRKTVGAKEMAALAGSLDAMLEILEP